MSDRSNFNLAPDCDKAKAAAHTPGPWEASLTANSIGQRFIYGPNNEHVALTYNGNVRRIGQQDANARLIAAAPDLLEALKAILSNTTLHGTDAFIDRHGDDTSTELDDLTRAARSAIQRAEGGQ